MCTHVGIMALRRCLALAALFALSSSMAACAAPTEEEEDAVSGEDAVVEAEGKPVISRDPNRLVDVPFYFSVPKDATTVPLNRRGYTYPTLWNSSTEIETSGLRILAINQKLPMKQLLPADGAAGLDPVDPGRVVLEQRERRVVPRNELSRLVRAREESRANPFGSNSLVEGCRHSCICNAENRGPLGQRRLDARLGLKLRGAMDGTFRRSWRHVERLSFDRSKNIQ